MPYYESVFIARPDISSAQNEALTDSFKTIISENGGSVTKTESWGLKTLAYRIKKNRKGHYSLMNLDAPPAAISELERNMRISEDVLRYMTLRVDELEEEPSIVMRSKGARDDRGPRGDRGPRDDAAAPKDNDKPETAMADAADDKTPNTPKDAPAYAPKDAPEQKTTAEVAARGDET